MKCTVGLFFIVNGALPDLCMYNYVAHVHCRKFATSEYIVSPPNMVCVTTLPSKIFSQG